ncbi:hypothetical protein [Renibacterium salmoninarum]|uniref:hypothetical protein n=1 Tax=Renibacterium salmoninarum TaxID=1646 RepID=UPI0011AB7B20|nr:hypothetical protein [Renibacterium salmoninarum]
MITTVIGTFLGLVAGIIPTTLMIWVIGAIQVSIPWLHLLVLLIVMPILGAGIAWVFTRSRVPMERRRTLV